MRLIDADRIIYAASIPDAKCVEYARDFIDAQPTIDAVPVVHAHWIRSEIDGGNKGYIRCSNCGADFSLPVHKMRGFYQRYCGTCGAKMDEEER